MTHSYRELTKWRPEYHFTAPRGWINDPNGLCYFKGFYHLFYQYNPKGCDWSSMYWGHAVSKDLSNWEDLPLALCPDQEYDEYEMGGCFSGSAIVYNDKLYLFYTGVSKHGSTLIQSQCMAYSEDGINFEKYPGNPIIIYPPADEGDISNFRDPKVICYNNKWYIVVGSTKGGLKTGDGRIFLYESDDLFHWTYRGILLKCNGKWTSMCECPDLFQLGGKWILMFSLMHAIDSEKTIYAMGEMDFENCEFKIEKTGEFDYGMDYYAPQSFLDEKGRRIMIAWQNSWWWLPWFNDYGPTANENWRGSMSYPRELKLRPNGELNFFPVEELESLTHEDQSFSDIWILGEKQFFEPATPNAYRLTISGDLAGSSAGIVEIGLKANEEKATIIRIDLFKGTICLDRNNADMYSKGKTIRPINTEKNVIELMVMVDRSSVEFFVNDGELCMTCTVFPEADQKDIWLRTASGKFHCNKISIDSISL